MYGDAVLILSKAISLYPDNYYLYVKRGVVFENQRSYQDAINDYSKSISIKPDYIDGYYILGNLKLE